MSITPDDPDYQYLAPDKKKLSEEQNQPFDGKKSCWIPDEKEGYVKAEIISTKGDDVTVLTEKQEVRSTCLYDRCFLTLIIFHLKGLENRNHCVLITLKTM